MALFSECKINPVLYLASPDLSPKLQLPASSGSVQESPLSVHEQTELSHGLLLMWSPTSTYGDTLHVNTQVGKMGTILSKQNVFFTFHLETSHIHSTFQIMESLSNIPNLLLSYSTIPSHMDYCQSPLICFSTSSGALFWSNTPPIARVIFLKYKSHQWCCSSTLKTFSGFQCSSRVWSRTDL